MVVSEILSKNKIRAQNVALFIKMYKNHIF
jgi:hypothetical protein